MTSQVPKHLFVYKNICNWVNITKNNKYQNYVYFLLPSTTLNIYYVYYVWIYFIQLLIQNCCNIGFAILPPTLITSYLILLNYYFIILSIVFIFKTQMKIFYNPKQRVNLKINIIHTSINLFWPWKRKRCQYVNICIWKTKKDWCELVHQHLWRVITT